MVLHSIILLALDQSFNQLTLIFYFEKLDLILFELMNLSFRSI
jgi:hypothetical protein